ncbi:hypothetical protein NIES4075_26040 [Tolypothrix sp. NIES-4075]|uniref:DUF6960 family protein n=1 Tax=Tolypothrix sp. NIES-4075 TaxID=2005459 RepID=UPI000B5C540E|nr:hypothetical protein [Tolypothrix sp. NIES-4075]GAX41607.1 hypothetical protein NIES4075_26040 [Tolypothrix sp. NIES-4075]
MYFQCETNVKAGTWGLYQWFSEHKDNLIFCDDRESFKALSPNGKVFHCISEDDNFLTLQYDAIAYRVKPTLYKQVATPLFSFGEQVKVINNVDKVGIIKGMEWHFQQSAVMYFLEIDGKYQSKRYWQQNLASARISL